MKDIQISIGGDEPTIWHPVETNAPKAYDGFGTFEIAAWEDSERGKVRLVLIRDEHHRWQTMRYSSGNYQWEESLQDEAAIAEELWERIRGRTNA